MKQNANFNFTVENIGDALVFIVSQIENEEYILEYVNYYSTYWRRGSGFEASCSTLLSIVKSGYENLYFTSNHVCPWMIDKISHPITCIYDPYLAGKSDYCREYDPFRKKTGNFETEFQDNSDNLKVNPFPYLNEFIQEIATLQNNKQLTKNEIMHLAENFIKRELGEERQKTSVLVKKKRDNNSNEF